MSKDFPEGFLWGTATSAFQVEMGRGEADRNSDWFVWANDKTNIKRGVVSGDKPENGPGFWELYPNDLRLAKKGLGNNAFRMSIDWSRIFPNPTWDVPVKVRFDKYGDVYGVDVSEESMQLLAEKAYAPSVQRYRDILAECKKLGLTVLLTLHHFTLPLWTHDPIACRDDITHATKKGWVDQKTVVEFAKYSAYVAKTLGDLADIYATFNEPMVVSGGGYLLKWNFPPDLDDLSLCVEATKNLAIAHGVAYEQIKRWDRVSCSAYGPAYVGIVHNPQYYEAFDKNSKADIKAARFCEYVQNEWILNMIMRGDCDLNLDMMIEKEETHPDLVKGCDFLGVNYYMRTRVKAAENKMKIGTQGLDFPPCTENCTDMGWNIYPAGIRHVVNWAYKNYRRRIFVTENGIADAKDKKRTDFLLRHLSEIHDAIECDNIPIQGYFHWSLLDNFEWAKGFNMKFGLYKVDNETKERTPTKAARLYKQIATTNKLPNKKQ